MLMNAANAIVTSIAARAAQDHGVSSLVNAMPVMPFIKREAVVCDKWNISWPGQHRIVHNQAL
jgi:hypothetical protein